MAPSKLSPRAIFIARRIEPPIGGYGYDSSCKPPPRSPRIYHNFDDGFGAPAIGRVRRRSFTIVSPRTGRNAKTSGIFPPRRTKVTIGLLPIATGVIRHPGPEGGEGLPAAEGRVRDTQVGDAMGSVEGAYLADNTERCKVPSKVYWIFQGTLNRIASPVRSQLRF